MKKLFILVGFLLPVFVLAAGAGGGGSDGMSGDTSGFLAPSVGSIPPVIVPAPVASPVVAEEKKESALTSKVLPPVRTQFCFTVPKLQQRIECRLGLSEDDLQQEYAKQYLPEECRALPKKQQADCVSRYTALQPCWAKPVGDERISCAKKVLEFPENLSDAKKFTVWEIQTNKQITKTNLSQEKSFLTEMAFSSTTNKGLFCNPHYQKFEIEICKKQLASTK